MPTFAILSRNPGVDLGAVLPDAFPDGAYVWSSSIGFVRYAGTAREVAQKAGIKHRAPDASVVEGRDQAVVIEVAPNYYGWTEATIWAWLKQAFEAVT